MATDTTVGDFWGVEVNTSKTICPVPDSFKVTKAILHSPSILYSGQIILLYLEDTVICKFTDRDFYEKPLDFEINEGDNITFTVQVVGCNYGAVSVHLSGYYITEDTTTEAMDPKIIAHLDDKFAKLDESAAASMVSIVSLREALINVAKGTHGMITHIDDKFAMLEKSAAASTASIVSLQDAITNVEKGTHEMITHIDGKFAKLDESAAASTASIVAQGQTSTTDAKVGKFINELIEENIIAHIDAKFAKLNESAAASTASIVAFQKAINNVEEGVVAMKNDLVAVKNDVEGLRRATRTEEPREMVMGMGDGSGSD